MPAVSSADALAGCYQHCEQLALWSAYSVQVLAKPWAKAFACGYPVILTVIHMRKLRHREVKKLTVGNGVGQSAEGHLNTPVPSSRALECRLCAPGVPCSSAGVLSPLEE